MFERVTVATVVEPPLRDRLDGWIGDSFAAVHAKDLNEAIRVVRERPVRAILVSPAAVVQEDLNQVDVLVRKFPGIPAVAVVARHDPRWAQRLLELGSRGVSGLLDLSVREGWERLREFLTEPSSATAALILGAIVPALGEVPPGCRRFFEVMVRMAPRTSSVKTLAQQLEVRPSTFMSRFFRCGLPSPKRYLSATRLLYAAWLLEFEGLSVAHVAYRLDCSSPQSFSRHLRAVLGLTATEFRRLYTFNSALQDFVQRLIVPYRGVFQTFHPLDHWVADTGQEWKDRLMAGDDSRYSRWPPNPRSRAVTRTRTG
jgi:AraC-like DNA-binding protein